MSGVTDLDYLLAHAMPILDLQDYVFVCLPATYGDYADWEPIASFSESEGLTLVIRQQIADIHELPYVGVFKRITLQVHSSLSAIGLTATFSTHLTENNISANIVAGFYHDHIFVPMEDADLAMSVLAKLAER